MIKIVCVCGARPNFMKIAPIIRAFTESQEIQPFLVHTGQHYDEKMSKLFFEELQIPKPQINLEVGSGSHACQTANIIKRFEPVLLEQQPDYVLVVGDVNSTIACGLVAVKMGIQLIHVESGLRSFDRTMPEEINRVLTDSISDLLFVTEHSGVTNLKNEGIDPTKIHLVGNVMIDTLLANRQKAQESDILSRLKVEKRNYLILTLHRPSNVDNLENLTAIIEALEYIEKDIKLIFPIHPRTRKSLQGTELGQRIQDMKNLILLEPVGYLDFLCLMSHAFLVMTDSGGIQEETTILGIPCMTLRPNTERPITITEGTNRLVATSSDKILEEYKNIRMNSATREKKHPPLWDGQAARRITEIIVKHSQKQNR